jgi:hypothetical protein
MPTLLEWEAALWTPQRVTIESSTNLIDAIQEKQRQYDNRLTNQGRSPAPRKLQLTTLVGFPAIQDLLVQPIRLLHRLGVITTPAIDNLTDICSTWAYIRYLWAFQPPSGAIHERLRLSQPALSIDFHQKGLMSDHIGIGMAALIMGQLLNAPNAVDVGVALNDPSWPINLTYDTSPDYVFFNADQSILYIVECKGTRCPRSSAFDQIRRGVEQLPSLVFLDGRPQPTSLVIGTQMNATSVHVYIVDPPTEDLPPDDRPTKVGPREWRIPDSRVMNDAVRHTAQAKLFSYMGSDEAAVTKLQQVTSRLQDFPRIAPRELEISDNDFGTFLGTRQEIPSRDRLRVEIFQAVQTSLYEAYIQDDVARINEELQQYRTNVLDSDSFKSAQDQRGVTRILRSVAADGTMLEIRLTPL